MLCWHTIPRVITLSSPGSPSVGEYARIAACQCGSRDVDAGYIMGVFRTPDISPKGRIPKSGTLSARKGPKPVRIDHGPENLEILSRIWDPASLKGFFVRNWDPAFPERSFRSDKLT